MCEDCSPQSKRNRPKFFKVKCSNKLLAWVAYMVLQYVGLLSRVIPNEWVGVLLIVTAIVTIIFMLCGPIDNAVSGMKITAELRAGIQKNIGAVINDPMQGFGMGHNHMNHMNHSNMHLSSFQ